MKKLSNWREEKRDEYGDLIGGPKISKKQLKKNLSSNEKDEKITRSESTKCGKGEYFCNDSQKCKPIPEGYHVMPDGMLMKGKKHSVNEVAPPTAKHERMVKHIKKSYKKDGKLSDDEKSIAYATAWKNYNKEEVIHEIAMKKDKKIPLGRKSNPYGKRAIAKMIIKSLAEPARAKAGVTREDYIDELSKSTLASYIEKGARDIAGKANDASIKGMSGKRKEADKGYEKTAKRVAGVSKAAGKLALKGTVYDKSKNEEVQVEGTKYGLYKGDGKPKGAMAAFAKKKEEKKPNPYGKRAKLKMLIKGFAEKNRMKSGNVAKEEKVCWKGYKRKPGTKRYAKGSCIKEGNKTWREFLEEGNRTARQLSKSKTQTTGNIAADRGDDEKKNRESRKGLEKDLKKKGIGYSKGVGEYKYKKDGKEGTKKEVSYQTTPGKNMSKRRFGKVMRRLGRKYDQESVITKKAGKSAQLHDTQSKQNKADKSFALGKSKPGKNPSKEGETSGTKVRSGKLPKKTKGAMHYGN